MYEFPTTKIFLLKDTHQIDLKKLKIQFRGHMLLKLRKTNQQEFSIEKLIKDKVINYMSNRKVMIVHLIAGLIKKT